MTCIVTKKWNLTPCLCSAKYNQPDRKSNDDKEVSKKVYAYLCYCLSVSDFPQILHQTQQFILNGTGKGDQWGEKLSVFWSSRETEGWQSGFQAVLGSSASSYIQANQIKTRSGPCMHHRLWENSQCRNWHQQLFFYGLSSRANKILMVCNSASRHSTIGSTSKTNENIP